MSLLFDGDTVVDGLVCRAGIDYSVDAFLMESGEWIVRPSFVVGINGYYYGRKWVAIATHAISKEIALRKVAHLVWRK